MSIVPVPGPDLLRRHLRESAFGFRPARIPWRIGAEVELLVLDAESGCTCPVSAASPRSSTALLREFSARHGWREEQSTKGTRIFCKDEEGTLSLEPGGQIEFSAQPSISPSALIGRLQSVVVPLVALAEDRGIRLLSVGIDPWNGIGGAPLRLHSERYAGMATYFETIGPAGARMMRQTAAFQISLDSGEDSLLQWRMLNALAPYLIAIFANSPVYGGAATGCRSYRAYNWRAVDPGRTGLFRSQDDVAREYLDFALAAPAMLRKSESGGYLPFGDWMERGAVTFEDWEVHLTTLFPEVRPRGYFEVRSPDAIPPEWYAAPIVFLAGLTASHTSLTSAIELVGESDSGLLVRASRTGLRDFRINRVSDELWEIALKGCGHLRPGLVEPDDLDIAREFRARYTQRGRSPADDPISSPAQAPAM